MIANLDEVSENSFELHELMEDESGREYEVVVGRIHLVGNCVVYQYDEILKALEHFMLMKDAEDRRDRP